MISYKPLFKTLVEKEITKTQLRELIGCSTATLSKFAKNEYVSLEIIDKICSALECDISDIIAYIPNK